MCVCVRCVRAYVIQVVACSANFQTRFFCSFESDYYINISVRAETCRATGKQKATQTHNKSVRVGEREMPCTLNREARGRRKTKAQYMGYDYSGRLSGRMSLKTTDRLRLR